MGGEGTITQMISSLKYNRELIKRIKPFRRYKEAVNEYKSRVAIDKQPKLTDEERLLLLKKINHIKKIEIKKTIAAVIISITIVLIGIYLLIRII